MKQFAMGCGAVQTDRSSPTFRRNVLAAPSDRSVSQALSFLLLLCFAYSTLTMEAVSELTAPLSRRLYCTVHSRRSGPQVQPQFILYY